MQPRIWSDLWPPEPIVDSSIKLPRSYSAGLSPATCPPVYTYIQDYTFPGAESSICSCSILHSWWLPRALIHQYLSARPLTPWGNSFFLSSTNCVVDKKTLMRIPFSVGGGLVSWPVCEGCLSQQQDGTFLVDTTWTIPRVAGMQKTGICSKMVPESLQAIVKCKCHQQVRMLLFN